MVLCFPLFPLAFFLNPTSHPFNLQTTYWSPPENYKTRDHRITYLLCLTQHGDLASDRIRAFSGWQQWPTQSPNTRPPLSPFLPPPGRLPSASALAPLLAPPSPVSTLVNGHLRLDLEGVKGLGRPRQRHPLNPALRRILLAHTGPHPT